MAKNTLDEWLPKNEDESEEWLTNALDILWRIAAYERDKKGKQATEACLHVADQVRDGILARLGLFEQNVG